MRYPDRLIIDECYSPDLSSMTWNTALESPFLLIEVLTDRENFQEPSVYDLTHGLGILYPAHRGFSWQRELSWTICFRSELSELFFLIRKNISFQIWLWWTFICAGFNSHTVWRNEQRVSVLITTILLTTKGIFDGLNCFGHEIYVVQTSMY